MCAGEAADAPVIISGGSVSIKLGSRFTGVPGNPNQFVGAYSLGDALDYISGANIAQIHRAQLGVPRSRSFKVSIKTIIPPPASPDPKWITITGQPAAGLTGDRLQVVVEFDTREFTGPGDGTYKNGARKITSIVMRDSAGGAGASSIAIPSGECTTGVPCQIGFGLP
jgi:hypothetical protein